MPTPALFLLFKIALAIWGHIDKLLSTPTSWFGAVYMCNFKKYLLINYK